MNDFTSTREYAREYRWIYSRVGMNWLAGTSEFARGCGWTYSRVRRCIWAVLYKFEWFIIILAKHGWFAKFSKLSHYTVASRLFGECMALRGEPNEPCIQHHVYIFMQYVVSYLAKLKYWIKINVAIALKRLSITWGITEAKQVSLLTSHVNLF